MSGGRRVRTASVITHGRPERSADALRTLLQVARETGTELRLDDQELEKHDLREGPGLVLGGGYRQDSDLCVVLGGDGSILKALRRQIWTGVPIYAVNLGEIGFLATVDPAEQDAGLRRAFEGDFETLGLPALEATLPDGSSWSAINDISVNRRSGDRVAELQYGIDGADVGQVRCDGLVVSTPAGSTGYNLANGGPILAWGVEGYAVSFIAPHTLSARALVVSPDGELGIHNGSSDPVELGVDGRPRGLLGAGETLRVHFRREAAVLAQTQGTSFYGRLQEKFGRLAG